MFSYISGKIASKEDGIVVLDVGGVGYEITVTSSALFDMPEVGEDAKLFTYFQVREDGVALYGFGSQIERSMFLKLINVSGVGPKMAIGVLSNIRYTDLAIAIVSEDLNALTSVKGIGKKTAERMILELKEKISPLETLKQGSTSSSAVYSDTSAVNEAVNTLVALGVTKFEALRLARAVSTKESTAEDIIVEVFKTLGK